MSLTAYHPLESVYKFHEVAERWILRRYEAAVVAAPGAERRRAGFTESFIDVFPERNPESTQQQQDGGQSTAQQSTIYTRTRLRMTDTSHPSTPSDVLFDPEGTAWQVVQDGRWDEARGYAPVIQRAGRRGQRPW